MKKLVITEPEYLKAEKIFEDSEFEMFVTPPDGSNVNMANIALERVREHLR